MPGFGAGLKPRLRKFVRLIGGAPKKQVIPLKQDVQTGRFKPFGFPQARGISRAEKIKIELEDQKVSENPLIKKKHRKPFGSVDKPKFRLTPRHPKL